MPAPESDKTHVYLKAVLVAEACDRALKRIAVDRDEIAKSFLRRRFPFTWRHRQADDPGLPAHQRRILEDFQRLDMEILRALFTLSSAAAQDHHTLRICVNIDDYRAIRPFVEEILNA